MTKQRMSHRFSIATLRTTSDFDGTRSVRHSAALRIMDHELHASKIIGEAPHYKHHWLCATQSVTCFPGTEETLHDALLYSDTIKSNIWVASVGSGSSITFGHAIVMQDSVCLATAVRVFARLDRKTNKPAPFTDEERLKIVQDHSLTVDSTIPIDFVKYPLPQIKRIEVPSFQGHLHFFEEEEAALKVKIGPQHVNYGNHADHAYLFETAAHALFVSSLQIRGSHTMSSLEGEQSAVRPTTMLVNYKSPGELNQVLHCYTRKNKAFIFSSADDKCCKKDRLILVAEMVVPTQDLVYLPQSHL